MDQPATAPDSVPPTISAAKQSRILVWRSEVAESFPDSTSPSRTTSAPSLASTATNTTSSSGGGGIARPPSRGRRFWRRLSRHLPGLTAGGGADDDDFLRGDGGMPDGPVRTSMYRTLGTGPEEENAGLLLAASSGNGKGGRGMGEKQERLERAARLLEKGAGGAADAPDAPAA